MSSTGTASSTFVKKLASNDKKTRDGALESLKKYLSTKSLSNKITVLDYEKLWKGLYFSMWYCDRPQAQERLSENLGKLYSESIKDPKNFLLFAQSFFKIMIIEWPSIDQWRIDKYYLLIRRVLRHNFKFLKLNHWDEELVNNWVNILVQDNGILCGDKSIAMALPYHICDIFLDELELIIFEDIQEEALNKDDEDYLEKYQQSITTKINICSEIPIKLLISPFETLNKQAPLKTLREKCKEEVLDDERLITWNVIEEDDDEEEDSDGDSDNEDNKDDEDDEDEDEDEWTGF
ncbi:hypothetical protein DFJ63DRAFT_319660 [Scheffersomyces coipomensis]|uniref:uncharacterized protein n=1 Tax=Scheffersomyces coipomensis TaxID=1788519 RepID=UPI00315D8683